MFASEFGWKLEDILNLSMVQFRMLSRGLTELMRIKNGGVDEEQAKADENKRLSLKLQLAKLEKAKAVKSESPVKHKKANRNGLASVLGKI